MLNDIEEKLLRLALDKGAYSGEAENAAIMFVRKLRERGAKIDEFTQSGTSQTYTRQLSRYHYFTMPFGKHKGTLLKDIPVDYLEWVLENCQNLSYILRKAIENVLDDYE